MVFAAALSVANMKLIKNKTLGHINIGLNGLVVFVFLTSGLYMLSELRENYLDVNPSQYYEIGAFHIIIRYISFMFLAVISDWVTEAALIDMATDLVGIVYTIRELIAALAE